MGDATINFNITTTSKTIAPKSPLPAVTDTVVINAYSQSGASTNTKSVGDNAVLKIVLDGTHAGASANGLDLETSGATVKELVIGNFGQSGITIGTSGSNNTIMGNFIGTNASGTSARKNSNGVSVKGGDNTIGGTTPATRNLLSGNLDDGIFLQGLVETNGNVVKGNYVGTDATGTTSLANGFIGMQMIGNSSTIGGSTTGERNVISGNGVRGLDISGSHCTVTGNYVGVDATGAVALKNGGDGIHVVGSSNQIGEATSGAET